MPAWFMSDDAEQFYTAWIAVLGPGPKKLLCAWHIDRARRTNLKSLISEIRILKLECTNEGEIAGKWLILCARANQCSSTSALSSAKSHVTSAISIINNKAATQN